MSTNAPHGLRDEKTSHILCEERRAENIRGTGYIGQHLHGGSKTRANAEAALYHAGNVGWAKRPPKQKSPTTA
jgi:hypothetical protein